MIVPISPFNRIVSLVPSITETLFELGLGDRVVGKTAQCDWPIECLKIPVIGNFSEVLFDNVLKINPDLILGSTLHNGIIETVRKSGIAAEVIPPQPAFEAPSAIKLIGKITGALKESVDLAEKVQEEICAVKNRAAQFSSKIVCYLCNIACPSWYSCTIAACIEFLNCTLAGRHPVERVDHSLILDEIIAAKPERIIVPKCNKCKRDCIDPLLTDNSRLKTYIEKNNIQVLTLTSKSLARPGPQAAKALQDLGKVIFDNF
jgi:iron complex transport system substrate-binding protein